MPKTIAVSKSPFADEYVGLAGRPQRYPWESLFNGKLWVVDPYLEYGKSLSYFQSLAFSEAKRRGVTIVTRTEGGLLYLLAPEGE